MQFVLKLFPEIPLKSRSIARRMKMILQVNLQQILQRIDPQVEVVKEWDKFIIRSANPGLHEQLRQALQQIPGIQYVLEVEVSSFSDLDDIVRQACALWQGQIGGRSFCVRAKRSGTHDFTSMDLQKKIGAALLVNDPAARVELRQPQVELQVEVVQQTLYLIKDCLPGLGGYPIGTQDTVLSLISGGFDSAVASYQLIRRGCRVHYCFFNLGGAAHQHGVQNMVHTLWQKFGSSHNVRLIMVDFSQVLAEILQRVTPGNQGVVLKRMMLRAADQVAQKLDLPALATGEAMGQVASQTLSNLNIIDRASDTMVLRPLIAWDKPEIIALAEKIGVRALAESIPEYCGAISNNPSIRADLRQVEKEEQKLDAQTLALALRDSIWFEVNELASINPATGTDSSGMAQARPACTLRQEAAEQQPEPGDIVLDIRAPNSAEDKPLALPALEVQYLPFYKLASSFAALDQSKNYFLYCERGVMSRLQAEHLRGRGYTNVHVYRAAA